MCERAIDKMIKYFEATESHKTLTIECDKAISSAILAAVMV